MCELTCTFVFHGGTVHMQCPSRCIPRYVRIWHQRAELLLFLSGRLFSKPVGLNNEHLVWQKKEGSQLSGTPSLSKLRRVGFFFNNPLRLISVAHRQILDFISPS